MGKNRKTYVYNRQTNGYRRNIQKGEFNKAGVKPPKIRNNPLLKKLTFGGAILWAVLCIAMLFVDVRISLALIILGIAIATALIFYTNKKDKDIIKTYIKMGIDKTAFNDALKKRGIREKQATRVNKLWDKVEKKMSP